MTEDIRFECDTFSNLKPTSLLDPRLGNLKKRSHRLDCITRFYLVLDNPVLFVKMKITLTNVIRRSPRRHEHHDFEVPLFTLFVSVNLIHIFWIVGNNALG